VPEHIALTYLFFAYLAAFLIIVGFVVRTFGQTRRLEAEVERLRQELGTDEGEATYQRAGDGGAR
jgi:CcmD family protein